MAKICRVCVEIGKMSEQASRGGYVGMNKLRTALGDQETQAVTLEGVN